VVPVDFAIRRPDPPGPGAPCATKLHWVQSMLDRLTREMRPETAWLRRRVRGPIPQT